MSDAKEQSNVVCFICLLKLLIVNIFIKYIVLSVYLDHINNNKATLKPEICCKYFYYKLKKLLLKSNNCNCGETYDCYKEMTQLEKDNIDTKILDICINYSINIDENTFKIFDKLDELVKSYNKFYYGHKNYSDLKAFIAHMKYVEGCEFYNSESIKILLKNYDDLFKTYVNTLPKNDPKYHYLTKDGYINGVLNVVSGTKEKLAVTEGQKYFASVTETHTDFAAGSGGGICFLFFVILVIVFILYKYTPYFLFLQPWVRRLRKKLKKNYKNNLCLMDTCEFEYKNSVDNRYKTAYN
ncbi:variable surface protein [Plasmodium gonderi]|uniref:Variable surface protein n=1 Tax=Plasmodium gonderi TaxID=77519 RepID=A0A1Y1JTM8_PLAGO|nr:variable surface protein [Plasmodium gonderi]GAW84112.1 variable surface protein [Plasmodium gonderi]